MAEHAARVFITGASGFIGRRLARRYRELGSEIRGVDLRPDGESGVVEGDVSEPGPWQDEAAGSDLVIHTAAILGFGGRLEQFWRINVVGTRHVLDAAVRAGAQRFLHVSSIVVFGLDYPDGVDERHPVKPTGAPYADTKIAAEQVVLAAHAGGEIPCTIVRPGDVYGPGSDAWLLRPLKAIRSGGFALPKGVVTPVYVDDLVEGIVLAAQSPRALGQIFTLADGTKVDIARFFEPYYQWLGKRGPRVLPAALLKAGTWPVAKAAELRGAYTDTHPRSIAYFQRRSGYSIEKARSVLGFEPSVGLEEGMERSREWLAERGMLQ